MTGFVVEDETSAVGAIKNIGLISRAKVREKFEERFTSNRMALDYLNVYRKVAQTEEGRKAKPRLVAG